MSNPETTTYQQVRIVNHGDVAHQTQITDAKSGEVIHGVFRVELVIDVNDRLPKATLHSYLPDVDVIASAAFYYVCASCKEQVAQEKMVPA